MRWYVLLGFLVWLGATILLRFVGQFLFATLLYQVLTFVGIGVVLVLVLLLLFVRGPRDPAWRMRMAVGLVLPGMLLDIVSVTFVSKVFPNIPTTAHGALAGCLL